MSSYHDQFMPNDAERTRKLITCEACGSQINEKKRNKHAKKCKPRQNAPNRGTAQTELVNVRISQRAFITLTILGYINTEGYNPTFVDTSLEELLNDASFGNKMRFFIFINFMLLHIYILRNVKSTLEMVYFLLWRNGLELDFVGLSCSHTIFSLIFLYVTWRYWIPLCLYRLLQE